eukprot:CAMPEP_0119039710 /NCGR_PEP_ID=MMETSP1177-20130426/9337_1 /TAXON_ID=2985 /ORGANISM="Ochromonas sp, Strain CCMP1899" /LENGTH=186 /DNA_ID=CAMNT_0007003917 /DNA_START=304 /DNA_END=860 /DNA_ORIENTATION=+
MNNSRNDRNNDRNNDNRRIDNRHDKQQGMNSDRNEGNNNRNFDSNSRKKTESASELFKEGSIYKGVIMKIESFGAFTELSGTKLQGLIHISQLSSQRVEDVNDVITVGDEVYVKVMKIEENVPLPGKTRIALSMKHCGQTDGTDKDPNGVDAEADERKRKPRGGSGMQEPLQLGAVLNTVCKKCGG